MCGVQGRRIDRWSVDRDLGSSVLNGSWFADKPRAVVPSRGAQRAPRLLVEFGCRAVKALASKERLGVDCSDEAMALGGDLLECFEFRATCWTNSSPGSTGTGRRLWNLSDGGHFENLGAYELIRRRVPVIVIVDAEADPDYTFEGLGNLVRKARTDFGAKIEFLDENKICEWRNKSPKERGRFGTLEMMRRGGGRRTNERSSDTDKSDVSTIGEVDGRRDSLAYAALAKVHYESATDAGEMSRSMLIYVKPTLVGDEPVDVKHYHAEHPDFPQQTTADQFFDEPQWDEQERMLGQVLQLEMEII